MSKKKILSPTPQHLLACSLVRNALSSHPTVELIEWSQLAHLIATSQDLKDFTDRTRRYLAADDEKAYHKQKCKSGAFIPAAQFDGGRRSEHITALTGVSMVDFDHVPDDKMQATLDLIRADRHAFMVYTTTSGHGIRVLFRYTCRQPQVSYADAWHWGNEYFSMITDLPHDPATRDPTRLSFLCHDPLCYFNPNAVPFEVISNTDAAKELKCMPPDTAHDPCPQLAASIADRHIPYAEGSRHANLRYRAFLMNKMGMAEADIASALEPFAPRGPKEAADLAAWVVVKGFDDRGTWVFAPTPGSKAGSAKKKSGSTQPEDGPDRPATKIATPEQIKDYLLQCNLLRYNVITTTVEVWSEESDAYVDINDRTANSLWHQANNALGRYVKPQDFDREVNSDAIPAYNPFASYFAALPPWDGIDHIGLLAARVHTTTDPEVFDRCFRKWFVAMAASWLDPQVLNQTILTFIGDQGIYKSTFFRRLLPPELSRYFLAKGNSTYVTKDDKLAVSGYALIDFEEIDSMKDSDLNAVKALVTTEVIAERATYARNRENHPHLASFCATGNNRTFLTDLTGNRRWLPFEVLNIDSPYDYPIDYVQLYAQAKALIGEGFQYWFGHDEDLVLEQHKSHFVEPCLEEEQLQRYYRKPDALELGVFLTTTEIVARCSADLRGQLSTKRMGQALKRLGFRQRSTGGKRGYILMERTFEEIMLQRTTEAEQVLREERSQTQSDLKF